MTPRRRADFAGLMALAALFVAWPEAGELAAAFVGGFTGGVVDGFTRSSGISRGGLGLLIASLSAIVLVEAALDAWRHHRGLPAS